MIIFYDRRSYEVTAQLPEPNADFPREITVRIKQPDVKVFARMRTSNHALETWDVRFILQNFESLIDADHKNVPADAIKELIADHLSLFYGQQDIAAALTFPIMGMIHSSLHLSQYETFKRRDMRPNIHPDTDQPA